MGYTFVLEDSFIGFDVTRSVDLADVTAEVTPRDVDQNV